MGTSSRRSVALALLALAALLTTACGGDDGEVRVFAASSLTDVMDALEADFEALHPDLDVVVALGGSQSLATQIEEGAPADVFISANVRQVERLAVLGLVAERRAVATNLLVVAVAEDSELTALEHLTAGDVRIAVGAPEVPVGALTVQALDGLPERIATRLRANVITEDPNVRAVRSRVELGEADAAFVYRTDVTSDSGLRAIELPVPAASIYVVAAISDDRASERSLAFLDYIGGDAADAILEAAGFNPTKDVP